MMRRLRVTAVTVLGLLTGCANLVDGEAISIYADPFRVAGLEVTDGPAGLRPAAKDPTREVQNYGGEREDELARQAVSDIEEFWEDAYTDPLEGAFRPVKALISWDSQENKPLKFCGSSTIDYVNAGYCFNDRTIGWDRGVLLADLRQSFGDMAVAVVMAHEFGHAISHQAELVGKATLTLVSEQQADCFAGVYMRWVAEDRSDRFELNTSTGLNNVLAALISLRDPVASADDRPSRNEHGSAFERVSAFQFGFTDGVAACAAIDADEVKMRRGNLPVTLPSDQSGDLEINEETVTNFVNTLNAIYAPARPPALIFAEQPCADARPSPPVSYCPTTNSISVEIAGLAKMGKPSKRSGLVFGDNTAFSALTSRYMLAVQHERGGLTLDNAGAALRTACLTGVASRTLSEPKQDPNAVTLSAGDLDEAVSGILTHGLAAGDVNGESVPAGFSRIDAFRLGVLSDEQRCYKRYP